MDQRSATGAADQTPDVETAVRDALADRGRVVLAVSGGRDSMVMLHAARRVAPDRVARVATYDHATGPHATEAAALVARVARDAGFAVARGRAGAAGRGEAEWRAARWAFLREAAERAGVGVVATAHTQDDQVETVFMRALRGAGPRGLAGLAAVRPDVVRPLVAVPRARVAAYAAAHGVPFVDDPSNLSRRHLRNRVRLDLLPAIERAAPGFRGELLALAARAASWRAAADALAAEMSEVTEIAAGRLALVVPAAALAGLREDELAVLWPALAARLGVTLDRRGTVRLGRFTRGGVTGSFVPLSGAASVRRERDRFVLRAGPVDIPSRDVLAFAGEPRALDDGVVCGRFRFRRAAPGSEVDGGAWSAELDPGAVLTVRPWAAGDRMHVREGAPARRVKRFFGDARISALDRQGWPVVLADGVIVWIPGVRRSDAATVRPGRPGVRYECDRYG